MTPYKVEKRTGPFRCSFFSIHRLLQTGQTSLWGPTVRTQSHLCDNDAALVQKRQRHDLTWSPKQFGLTSLPSLPTEAGVSLPREPLSETAPEPPARFLHWRAGPTGALVSTSLDARTPSAMQNRRCRALQHHACNSVLAWGNVSQIATAATDRQPGAILKPPGRFAEVYVGFRRTSSQPRTSSWVVV